MRTITVVITKTSVVMLGSAADVLCFHYGHRVRSGLACPSVCVYICCVYASCCVCLRLLSIAVCPCRFALLVCLSVCLYVWLSVCLFVRLLSFLMFYHVLCLSVCLLVCVLVCLCACPYACVVFVCVYVMSVCIRVYLCVSMFA